MKTHLLLRIACLFFSLNLIEVYATDTFSAQTNEYLIQKIDSFQFNKNDPEVWKYLNAYILKSKVRKDYKSLFYGYKEGIYFSNDYEIKLKYADSAIVIAHKTKMNDLLVQSYLSKGIVYYQNKKFQPALQNYLLAERKLNTNTSDYLSYKVIFNLALIKYHLKQFPDADELFRKCSTYFEKNSSDTNHQAYFLNTLYYRASIQQAQQNLKESTQLNYQGFKLSEQMQNAYFIHYFSCSIAFDKYAEKEYQKTIQLLAKEINYLKEQQDFNTLSKAYFYIGKSFEKLNKQEKSIEYYEKIDQLFNQYEFLDIELRPAYEYLINYSIENKHYEKELYCINQLLKLDLLTQENFVQLSTTILKEYDVKELLKLKKQVELKIYLYPILVMISIVVSSIGLYFIYIRFVKNRKTQPEKNITDDVIIDIPNEIVLEILIQLDEFEANELFLQQTITLSKLAKSFKTNTAYLSKIINSQKKTNFSNYLNQLKVNYIINLLKRDEKYHKHTMRDLAELSGFSTTRHFSDAFFQSTTLRPNEFIKQLKHQLKWDELKDKND